MDLFSSYALGDLELPNRVVMSPMTRSRAVEGHVPSPLATCYYAQRASAGLIVTEASQVSPRGVGYLRTPGIHSLEQAVAWKRVADAVHQAGGRIFLQLWHVGRVSHPDFHGGELPVAPSAVAAEGEVLTPEGRKTMVTPRALDRDEIAGLIEQFVRGATHAKTAGFDGVELHGANGYLLDQFLRDGSNHRTDAYGGSVRNRARFALELTEAVMGVWGPGRVGYKISPAFTKLSMIDSNPIETFSYLAEAFTALHLGYLHVSEPISGSNAVSPEARISPHLHNKFTGTFIVNGGYGADSASGAIDRGEADLVSFGVKFLANPDLPERFRRNAPLNSPDRATFYSGEDKGYMDYPTLNDQSSGVQPAWDERRLDGR